MVKNVRSQKCLVDRVGTTTFTLSTIVKNRKKLEVCYVNYGEISAFQRLSIKTGRYFDVEGKFMSWFTTAQRNNIAVRGPLLQEKGAENRKRTP